MYSITIERFTDIDQDALILINDLLLSIPEFATPYTQAEVSTRLANKSCLLLLVRVEGEIAGFKLGYALNQDIFYSWLGGIVPDFRGLGLANQLLNAQENWVKSQRYRMIEVKTRNCFRSMLKMLIHNQYQIIAMEQDQQESLQHKLHLQKAVSAI